LVGCGFFDAIEGDLSHNQEDDEDKCGPEDFFVEADFTFRLFDFWQYSADWFEEAEESSGHCVFYSSVACGVMILPPAAMTFCWAVLDASATWMVRGLVIFPVPKSLV